MSIPRLENVLRLIAALGFIFSAHNVQADDAYFDVRLDQLHFTSKGVPRFHSGALGVFTDVADRQDVVPYAVLDGDGEVLLHLLPNSRTEYGELCIRVPCAAR